MSTLTQFKINAAYGIDITKSQVTIKAITGNSNQTLLDETINQMSFEFDLSNSEATFYFVTAEILQYTYGRTTNTIDTNKKIEFVAVFKKANRNVTLAENQTIASMYAFNQFIQFDNASNLSINATDRQLKLALGMKDNFVHPNAAPSPVIMSSPNGFETNSWALLNSLSNLMYESIKEENIFNSFLQLTNTTTTNSFLVALNHLVNDPFLNAEEIYNLGLNQQDPVPYQPYLQRLELPEGHSPIPNQWTLAIKVNDSGANNFLIAGPAFVAFDKNDRGWMTNNVTQGTPNSSSMCVVFEPNGKPAHFSPVFGGGLLGAGFGVTPNNSGDEVFFGNFGWGPTQCNPHQGSISRFSAEKGGLISPSNGYSKGLSRAQGLNFDASGNLWVTSWGSQEPFAPATTIYPFKNEVSAIVVYLKNDSEEGYDFDHPLIYPFENAYRLTFDVITKGDYAIVACGGNYDKNDTSKCGLSGVYKFTLDLSDKEQPIKKIASWDYTTDPAHFINQYGESSEGYESFKQVALDSEGNVYVGAIRTKFNRIVKLNSDLVYQNDYTHKLNHPWSVTIDRENVIFAGNFGPELLSNTTNDPNKKFEQLPTGTTGVTIMREDENGNASAQLMTLPSGGGEVMLANGFPLYGVIKTNTDGSTVSHPCFTPLMRITSSSIDGAGNLWVINNWKPSVGIDLLENPGGDGIVIFVGVAAPTPYQFG